MNRSIAAAVLFFWLTVMSATGAEAQAAGVTIQRVSYKGWADAYRLSNGMVDVVVVPSVGGRVMRYGYVGGPNAFWENPTAAGKPIPLGTWANTGGDKIWPWSQDDWPALIGRNFPPPVAADQAPHQAEVVGSDTLRLTSSRVVPWGFRIVRDIRLAPTGTQVYVSSRFVQEGTGSSPPVGVWAITQVPATPLIFARLTPQASSLENGIKPMGAVSFTLTRPAPAILQAARFSLESGKFGTDADLLASLVNDDTLLTLRFAAAAPADNAGAAYQPGERAQIYNQPDDAEAQRKFGVTAYNELELTSPRKTLKPGDTLTLNVVWELRRLSPDKRNPAAISALIKALP